MNLYLKSDFYKKKLPARISCGQLVDQLEHLVCFNWATAFPPWDYALYVASILYQPIGFPPHKSPQPEVRPVAHSHRLLHRFREKHPKPTRPAARRPPSGAPPCDETLPAHHLPAENRAGQRLHLLGLRQASFLQQPQQIVLRALDLQAAPVQLGHARPREPERV